jgi:lipopolysaccharide/colanic/teichoic acid biosynthesis glycosyltransferase
MSDKKISRRDQLKSLERRLEVSPRRAALRRLRMLSWRLTLDLGRAAKRGLDIIVSLLVFLMLSPALLLVALLIKLTDGGPVLFWQTRVGRWGKTFPFPKFRSMVVNAEALRAKLMDANEHGSGVTFKMKRDPRITWIGRFIRKTSIDELPQLWCVLRGDMSLVGPRPALVNEVARYSLDDRSRLDAIPGLTCIWQVSGRSNIPFPQQVNLDVQYIEEQSLWTDLKLLVLTIPAVITGRGAY